jgi:hypothetical protein
MTVQLGNQNRIPTRRQTLNRELARWDHDSWAGAGCPGPQQCEGDDLRPSLIPDRRPVYRPQLWLNVATIFLGLLPPSLASGGRRSCSRLGFCGRRLRGSSAR